MSGAEKTARRYFFALLVSELLPVFAYGVATVLALAAFASLSQSQP